MAGLWTGGGPIGHLMRRMLPGERQHHSVVAFVTLLILGFASFFALLAAGGYPWMRMTHAFGTLSGFALAGWVYAWRGITPRFVIVATCLCVVYIIALDMAVMSQRSRSWAAFVIVLDSLVLFRASPTVSAAVVGFVCVYLTVCNADLAVRFGLLDLPGMMPYDDRRSFCDCEKPPCGMGISQALAGSITQIVIFVTDYVMTRWFATQMWSEKEAMKSAVDAAEHIAASLAGFDLPAAEAYLADRGGALPADLLRSLSTLLENLHSYRPFLPSALFDGAEEDGGAPTGGRRSSIGSGAAAPGLISESAALVFTDIRSSTALWETSGALMKEALGIHNDVIRSAAAGRGGYEVKTIGDSFMLAFEDAGAAVLAAAEVQARFADVGLWPEGLARPGMDDGYPAMCVRIGVHAGAVTVERNELSGRYDYFGPTVNKAARVETHGVGGTVTVTKELLEALEPGVVEGMTVVEYPHARWAKGLSEPLRLVALLPAPLCEREAFVLEQCAQGGQLHAGPPPPSDLGGAVRSPVQSIPASSYSDVSASAGPLQMWQRTARSVATVGVVRYAAVQHPSAGWERVEGDLARRAETLEKHLRATGGHIGTLLHDLVVVSWGVQARLPQHVASSARFLTLLQGSWAAGHDEPGGVPPYHAGVATGAVACGQVAASRKERFVTLLGPCVNLAAALCFGAAELRSEVLVAALGGAEGYDAVDTLRPHVRPVDAWAVHGRAPEAGPSVTVYELHVAALRRWRENQGAEGQVVSQGEPDAPRSPTISGQYWRAFACRDVAALEDLGRSTEDPVAASVARLMELDSHLPHALAVCQAPPADAETSPPPSSAYLLSPSSTPLRTSGASVAWG
eukprot:TRINITY_DN3818_c0_g1_i5.p1 TRINITY_DN3818_c0_g1~~TRINITY_DN3818_c0_g1_i5.p1  ORF type:complete len:855 (+),score=173.24 TRINITY_DN3818_c0_g1_i5:68-2632(+)